MAMPAPTLLERENRAIGAAQRTPEARHPHRFRPAVYTAKNGHPRCALCGDEEPVGGTCDGSGGLFAKAARAFGRLVLKAEQLGLRFGERKPVQRPGTRGGRGFYDGKGTWRYGDRPAGRLTFRGDAPLSIELRRQKAIAFRSARVDGPEDVAAAFRAITDIDRERHYVVAVDADHRILTIEATSIGSLTATIAAPREMMKVPLALGATHLYLLHNHPSGDPTPSPEDHQALHGARLVAAALGMTVEGLVVGREGWAPIGGRSVRPYPDVESAPHYPREVEAVRSTLIGRGMSVASPEQLERATRGLFAPESRSLFAVLVDQRGRILAMHALGVNCEAAPTPTETATAHLLALAITSSAAAVAVVGGADGEAWQNDVPAWVTLTARVVEHAGIRFWDALLVGSDSYRSVLNGNYDAVRKAAIGRVVRDAKPDRAGRQGVATRATHDGHDTAVSPSPQPAPDSIATLASRKAAIEKDLFFIADEDLPALADRDDNAAVMAKAFLAGRRGALLHDLRAVEGALVKARALHGRRELDGLQISIENRRGSLRHWTDHDGTEGSSRMSHPYGYVRGTVGSDGDHVDCFLGPLAETGTVEATTVYVVTTRKPPEFRDIDEQKCLIGWPDLASARAAFVGAYSNGGAKFIHQIDALSWTDFKREALASRPAGQFVRGDVVERGTLAKAGRLVLKAAAPAAPRPAGPRLTLPGAKGPTPGTPADTSPLRADAVSHGALAKELARYLPALTKVVEQLAATFPGVPIAGRLKESASLAPKLQAKEPIAGMDDFATARLTLESIEDEQAALPRLQRTFQVRSTLDCVARPSPLGYRGIDCVADVDGVAVTIQLRTARQNQWTEYAHDAAYRTHEEPPPELAAYLRAMSGYFAALDAGDEGEPPPCPPIVQQQLGCLKAA